MSAGGVDLSIIAPAYQEEGRIGPSLEKLTSWAGQRAETVEIVVVDDGSRDGTAALVAGYAERGVRLVRLPVNRGKGAALRAGVAASGGARVLLTDVDLSTPIAEVDRLTPYLESADVVMGSRALSESRITRRQPIWRELAGKTFNAAIRLLGVRGFRDTQCGFKLLRGDVARELFAAMTIDRYAYDVELVWLAQRRGYRVIEVGVEWRDEGGSRVRVLRDGTRMLIDVLRLRLRSMARGAGGREGT